MTQPQIESFSMNYGGFAFRQSDDDLREAFNRELAKFIGSDEHLELITKFGFDESNLPGDVTADQLVNGGDAESETEEAADDDAADQSETEEAAATTQPADG